MKKCKLLIPTAILSMLLLCCKENQSVIIGNQEWASENLAASTFRNGEEIMEARTNQDWEKAGKDGIPAWCYYGNNYKNNKKYGKLYNWYAVNDPRGLAPEGWHIPDKAEFSELISFLGGENDASLKLKSTKGWDDIGNGTNSSGFSAMPCGWRSDIGEFKGLGGNGSWWSSSEYSATNAWYMSLEYFTGSVNMGNDSDKQNGISVRCIKD